MRRLVPLAGAAISLLLAASSASAEVVDCTPIETVPVVITAQGIYCLKHDLATSMTSGTAILVNTNNVTIEMNGFKLGGLGGGTNTTAYGIASYSRQNVTVRNGTVRGFYNNVYMSGGLGQIVEDLRLDGARGNGLFLAGSNLIARNNFITNTGEGAGSSASGIYVDTGYQVSITGNIIGSVSETSTSNGIRVEFAEQSVIDSNEIHGVIGGGTRNGIYIGSGDRNVLRNNIVTTSSGSTGIGAYSSSDACVRNAVTTTFVTPYTGCETSRENDSY
ncbi:right-handed parallel beta-helix repeat-containing protein [Mesorhizobium sp. J428]|uniref:NosD domain-containing protein n=1 Tax=Mesorhizobium sp. J428 TaxID=2898440 RepID=UPI00215076CD|nr:right-handed parallel beta-helix repeat-containing protein [Mesorhizobium sp. J428]MCR5855629.1 hypothetical protein [Mesorhizobium sp. J428]